MMKKRQVSSQKSAVTEIVGTMLLLGISVSLFTVVYVSVLSVPSTPPTPSANIICKVVDGDLVFTHVGGSELPTNTQISLNIKGENQKTFTIKNNMSSEDKSDGKWSLGEQVHYSDVTFLGREVDFSIIDVENNAIVVSGFVPAINPIVTIVNDLFTCNSNPLTITASSTGTDPDNVTLWYKWNGYWEDTFDNEDDLVSSYHNMTFENGYAEVNKSGEGTDIIDYVDNQNVAVDGISDIGSHSDFNSLKNSPTDGTDILSEVNINPSQTAFADNKFDNIGSHSDFSAMQAGPDGIIDILTESSAVTSGWITPDDVYDYCGQNGGQNVDLTIDGYTNWWSYWYHNNNHNHWIEFDLGQTRAVSSIRIYQSSYLSYRWGYDGTVNVFVSNDPNNWGSAVDTGWNAASGSGWQSTSFSAKEGRYIRLEQVGGSSQERYHRMYEFNAYVEGTNCELDLEVEWTNLDYSNTQEQLCIYMDEGSNSHSLDCSGGGYMQIGDGSSDWGSERGTISFWVKLDDVDGRPWGQDNYMETRFEDNRLKLDWGTQSPVLESNTIFSTDKWYFIAITWDEYSYDLNVYIGDESNAPTLDNSYSSWPYTVSDEGVDENLLMKSGSGYGDSIDGHADDLRYYNNDRSLSEIQSDYNIQLNGNEPNLKSYFKLNNNFDDIGPNNDDGSGVSSYSFSSDIPFINSKPPSEDLKVDVWDGSNWQNLISNLETGWNNESVTSYLDSSDFRIRFKDSDNSDTTQDIWLIDCAVLNLSSDPNYRMSMQVNWTDVDYTQPYEELCIYSTSLPSEYLKVDVWDGSNWVTIINALNNGWTNTSVKSYLNSERFVIRFNDTDDSDTILDTWEIGSVLLHVWTPGTGIYYEGNIKSDVIQKPSSADWSSFYVDVDNPGNGIFKILDSSNNELVSDLNDGSSISSISEDSIYLYGNFSGSLKLDSWKVTVKESPWIEWSNPSNPDTSSPWEWSFNFPNHATNLTHNFYFYSIGHKSGWPSESPPMSPDYDTSCVYED